MRWLFRGTRVLLLPLLPVAIPAAPLPPASDGGVLHVDFENHIESGVGLLNAGVRWVGYPFTSTVQKISKVLDDPALAFHGQRCGYVVTDTKEQRGRLILQRRADNPDRTDEVSEFMFRPVSGALVEMSEFIVWSSGGFREGSAGLVLLADAAQDTDFYTLSVRAADGLHRDVTRIARPNEWIRIVILRRRAAREVDIWVGRPGQEARVGQFADLDATRDVEKIELGDLSEKSAWGSGYWDDVRVGHILPAGAKPHAAEARADLRGEGPKIDYPVTVESTRQLFVDDGVIESQSGLRRTFHSARKYPKNPLIVPDRPWEHVSLIDMGRVERDSVTKKWRYWYGSWGTQVNKPTFMCVAESGNGIEWVKPNLGLIEFNGTKDNNIIREGRMFGVVMDPDPKDPQKKYRAIIRDAGFLSGSSPDGLRWKTAQPVLDQAYDASSVSWDPVGRKWIASCKIWYENRRVRGYAESQDFENWTDTRVILLHDELDGPHQQLYAMPMERYESIYIGSLKIYHTDTDRCDVQLAFSRNAKNWIRPNRQPFIPNGAEVGSWDYANLDQSSGYQIVGDEIWFYYGGRSILHNAKPNDGSIGLATLRRDGFASMDSSSDEGVLITKPLLLKGQSLFINAEASQGSVVVEIIDAETVDTTADNAEAPVFPFFKAACTPVKGDSTRQEVRWQDANGFGQIHDRPVRLKFHLRHARLYSFWTE